MGNYGIMKASRAFEAHVETGPGRYTMRSDTTATKPAIGANDKSAQRRRPVRVAVIAAALGVAACFGAAASFSGDPAVAAENEATENR